MLDGEALINSEAVVYEGNLQNSFDPATLPSKNLSKPSVNTDIIKINVESRRLHVCSSSKARSPTIEMCHNHIQSKIIRLG